MATYPVPSAPHAAHWATALRFLAIGAIVASLVLTIWWTNRLADHLEDQRELLLQIQRDVLVNQSQVAAVLASTEQTERRLSVAEDRVSNAAEDRRQLRDMDQKMLEAIVSLRASLNFPAVVPLPPAPTPRRPRTDRSQ